LLFPFQIAMIRSVDVTGDLLAELGVSAPMYRLAVLVFLLRRMSRRDTRGLRSMQQKLAKHDRIIVR
jgi:hypothetical protein